MKNQKKALANLAINIMSNLSVIGAGLALYEKKWECLIIASISASLAALLAWRSSK